MSEELIKRLRDAAHMNRHLSMPSAVLSHLLREAADALSRQERGEAVANQCDGCGRGLLLDDDGMHRAESGHPVMVCQRSRYARPTPDAGRVAELEAECKRLREEVHAHASNEVDFAEQNAALEAQLAETKKAYRSMVDANRAASERLAESLEREGRMREALEESVALNVNWVATAEPEHLAHLSEYKAVITMGEAALATEKEQTK